MSISPLGLLFVVGLFLTGIPAALYLALALARRER
jgi:hypothetical protein